MDLTDGAELDEVGFDVEHWGPIDGVETSNGELSSIDSEELAAGDTDAVGSRLGPLCENADPRPVLTPAWPTRAGVDLLRLHAMEVVDHFEVAEGTEPEQGFLVDFPTIDADYRFYRTPVVVGQVAAW